MSRADIVELFALISAAYPKDQAFANADKPTALMWYEMLKDMPFEAVKAALAKHAAISRFPPTIADLRAAIAPNTIPQEEAWGIVLKAIRDYGCYRQTEARDSMPPEVWQTVDRMGWRELCMSENVDVIRAQFMRMYDAQSRRNKERAALPAGLAQRLEQIGALPSTKLLASSDE
jgi:hypothetical protein